MENKKINFSKMLCIAIIIGIITLLFNISIIGFYLHEIKVLQEQNLPKIEYIINNLKILDNKNTYTITVTPDAHNYLTQNLTNNYENFMSNYYTIQSEWLNKWLTALTLILGILAIIIPILFVKFLEIKEKEIECTKREIETVQDALLQDIDEVNQKKFTMQLQVNDVEEKYNKIIEYSQNIAKDVEHCKQYVIESESLTYYTKGLNEARKNNNEKAIEYFKEALKNNTTNDEIYASLARLQFDHDKNEIKFAKSMIEKAIELNPKAEYYSILSAIYFAQKDKVNAIVSIEKAIELEPRNEIYIARLALYYAETGEKNKSENTIKRIKQDQYTSIYIPGLLGLAEIKNNNYKSAIKYLANLYTNTGDIADLYNLTEAYIMNSNIKEALDTLRLYIKECRQKSLELRILEDDYHNWLAKINTLEDSPEKDELIKEITECPIKKRHQYE